MPVSLGPLVVRADKPQARGSSSTLGRVRSDTMKRIALFLLTNLAVMLVLSVAVHVLGLNRFLTANGLNMGALMGFSLIMGFVGGVIPAIRASRLKIVDALRET